MSNSVCAEMQYSVKTSTLFVPYFGRITVIFTSNTLILDIKTFKYIISSTFYLVLVKPQGQQKYFIVT